MLHLYSKERSEQKENLFPDSVFICSIDSIESFQEVCFPRWRKNMPSLCIYGVNDRINVCLRSCCTGTTVLRRGLAILHNYDNTCIDHGIVLRNQYQARLMQVTSSEVFSLRVCKTDSKLRTFINFPRHAGAASRSHIT